MLATLFPLSFLLFQNLGELCIDLGYEKAVTGTTLNGTYVFRRKKTSSVVKKVIDSPIESSNDYSYG